VGTEAGQSHGQLGGRADADGADAARAGHQGRGLVPGHLQALVQDHVVAALEGQVGALAGDQPVHRRGQAASRPDTLGGRVVEQDVLGQAQQRVAGQDGGPDPEHGPGRGPVPPLGVAVHDVVVQQREVVHELHGRGRGDAPLGRRAGGPGRQQGQRRAQRLAALALTDGGAVSVDEAQVVGRDDPDVGAEPLQPARDGRSYEVTCGGNARRHGGCHEVAFAAISVSLTRPGRISLAGAAAVSPARM
jgi:hypothetical protein